MAIGQTCPPISSVFLKNSDILKRVASKVEICLGMLAILATSGNCKKKKTLVQNGKTLFYLKSAPPTENRFVGILLSF